MKVNNRLWTNQRTWIYFRWNERVCHNKTTCSCVYTATAAVLEHFPWKEKKRKGKFTMALAAPFDVIDSLNKEFECSVCMDRLRNARCLFCQHTFCFDCLESCVQSGREAASVITCPVCRVVTRLPREGVAGLKGNALINSVLGKLEEWDKNKNHGPSK